MANITDWYGQNDINWGKLYSESWWGSVNEANSWGIIYPESAEGSNVYADTTSFTSDTTSLTADNGVADGDNGGDNGGDPVPTSDTWWTPNQAEFVNDGIVPFTYTFNGTTYTQGIVATQVELSGYNGDATVSGTFSSKVIKLDTATPQVGSHIFDAFGTIIKQGNQYGGDIGFWENFASPKFVSIKSSSSAAFSGNVFSPFPIYKLGQVGEYVKITEIISS